MAEEWLLSKCEQTTGCDGPRKCAKAGRVRAMCEVISYVEGEKEDRMFVCVRQVAMDEQWAQQVVRTEDCIKGMRVVLCMYKGGN